MLSGFLGVIRLLERPEKTKAEVDIVRIWWPNRTLFELTVTNSEEGALRSGTKLANKTPKNPMHRTLEPGQAS